MSKEEGPPNDPRFLTYSACRKIHCGLRWDPEESASAIADLDLIYALYDEYGRCQAVVSGKDNVTTDRSGSVYHSGDDADGAESGDDERVSIDLFSVPQNIHYIFLMVEISSIHTFGNIVNPYIRIVHAGHNREMSGMSLRTQEGKNLKSMIYVRLDRRTGGWYLNDVCRYNESPDLPVWEDVLIDFLPALTNEKRVAANLPLTPKKGETVPLFVTQQARHRINCGISWDLREGGADNQIDVDLTAIMYDSEFDYMDDVSSTADRAIDQSGAVYHSGDAVTGASAGDDEVISVELLKLPHYVSHIVFVMDMKTDHNLSDIRNPTIRISDSLTDATQLGVKVDQSQPNHNAYIFAHLARGEDGWHLHYIGKTVDTGELNDWSEAIVPLIKS